MADKFRRDLDRRCAVGGVKCFCCNDYHKKDQAQLRRQVRRAMKQEDRKELE